MADFGVEFASFPASAAGEDGRFNGFEPLVCADDQEAIEMAKRLTARHPIELWSGARLLHAMPRPLQQAVYPQIDEGRTLPKSAT